LSTILTHSISLSFRGRRRASIAATLAVILMWVVGAYFVDVSLGRTSIYSGVTLLVCLFALTLIGLRKRLIMLPLMSVSTWVQIHIYTAMFACVAYVIHVPSIIANGYFESLLSWLFIVVSVSGFYGLYTSRTAPKRLTALSTQVRYDRIAWHRDQIVIAAKKLLDQLPETPDRNVLASFYQTHVQPHFVSPVQFLYLMRPTTTKKRQLLGALADLDRYMDARVRQAAGKLAALIRTRDELDYQYAIQFRLRAWVILHAAMSLLLLVTSIFHAILVLGWMGS